MVIVDNRMKMCDCCMYRSKFVDIVVATLKEITEIAPLKLFSTDQLLFGFNSLPQRYSLILLSVPYVFSCMQSFISIFIEYNAV